MERAETPSRLFEVGARITLLPNTAEGYQNEWQSLLRATGAAGQLCAEIRRPDRREYGEIPDLRPRQPGIGGQPASMTRANRRALCARR